MVIKAVNYGDNQLFAHISFEDGVTTDLMGNLKTKNNGLQLSFDAERNGNVAGFTAGNKSNLELLTYPFQKKTTMSFWFKRNDPDSTAPWRMAFAAYAPDGSNIYFTPVTTWNSSNSYLVSDSKPFQLYRSAAGPVINNQVWTHVVIVFDENIFRVYVDGKYYASTTNPGSVLEFNTTLHYFGNHPGLNYPMTGFVDEIRIYHTVLTDTQIKALHAEVPFEEYREVDAPYASFPFEIDAADVMKQVSADARELSLVNSTEGRKVAQLSTAGNLRILNNPIGNDKYTLAFLYKKESFSKADSGKVLFQFTNDQGDYIALVNRYNEFTGAKIEMELFKDGVITNMGVSTAALKPNQWNSVVLVQTYSATLGVFRLYLNGFAVKTGANFYSNSFNLSKWIIGAEKVGATADGQYDEVRFYQREMTASEISRYNAQYVTNIKIELNPDVKFQTIRNFGASDGWSTQFVGKYFSNEQKERIAEILFSKDYDTEGNPKGIGLSAWRYNIGAGTAEQGAASRINTETRRTEGFLNSDGTYDWSKQAGQQYFLKKAVAYGVNDIIGWQNSPPIPFTVRGLGFREYGDPIETILKSEHYDDFGNFLADVILHFKDEGVNIRYISPLNEPQYAWAPSAPNGMVNQEGTPWTNQNISDVVKAINQAFQQRNVDSKLFITEAGAISHLLSTSSGHATNQLYQFWNPGSGLFVGDLPSMSNVVSSHSYWEETDANKLIDTRVNLLNEMKATDENLEFWQTEYSFLGTGYQWGHPSGTISPIQSAVSLSRVIHTDLTVANATGWQWWTSFESLKHLSEEDRYALIRIAMTPNMDRCVYNPTKLLYGLGNYSFFIRPGMKRIELNRSDNMPVKTQVVNQMFSAFMDDESGKVVIVATNFSQDNCNISIPETQVAGLGQITQYTPYITSGKSDENMKRYPVLQASQQFVLPGLSIVTFVGEINGNVGVEDATETVLLCKVYPNPSNQYLKIKANGNIKQVYVMDLLGRVVYNQQFNQAELTLRTDGFYAGNYILNIKTEEGTEKHKIMIVK
jgi:O-glycosyl hydrolase